MVGELPAIRRELDRLYRSVDDLLRAGKYDECDQLLRDAEVERMGPHLLVGLLTITIRHREQLAERDDLVLRVRARLQDLVPERTERLLRGLE